MGFIAVVSAGESEPGQPPPGFGLVGGITLLERQVRALLDAGAQGVAILAAALPADIAARFAADQRCWRVATAEELAQRLHGDDRDVIVLAQAVLLDERLIATVARSTGPILFDFASTPPAGAERIDSQTHWAGIARLPAAMVAGVAADLGEWELTGTLVRAAVEAGAARLSVESLPVYAPARRRDVEILWAVPVDPDQKAKATEALIAASQKGCLDWPARFIHPPIENAVVRLLLPTPHHAQHRDFADRASGCWSIMLFASGSPGGGWRSFWLLARWTGWTASWPAPGTSFRAGATWSMCWTSA
jgi:1L-myo-inositol 1-phosphate cytidylyltransferase / CDP-L-myo-inositol myo-inositolphosphotransferase